MGNLLEGEIAADRTGDGQVDGGMIEEVRENMKVQKSFESKNRLVIQL